MTTIRQNSKRKITNQNIPALLDGIHDRLLHRHIRSNNVGRGVQKGQLKVKGFALGRAVGALSSTKGRFGGGHHCHVLKVIIYSEKKTKRELEGCASIRGV